MKIPLKSVGLLFLLLSFTGHMMGQFSLVKGKILDEKTGDPLAYVNVGVRDTSIGTFSDENGEFKLELPKGNFTLIISLVGYEKKEYQVSLDGEKPVFLEVNMVNATQELNTVVVSASKYAQRIQESVSSIEVLKPSLIQNSNIQSVDKALDAVPGVTVVDNEPQIRAGSGFSSGLGSRVMILVDEIPLLRGDAGRPDWSLMPVHDIEQIEIVKGASSVVYGSSALSGAINVRTAWPKEKPKTEITSFIGMYSKPSRRYDTPWTGWNPLQFGLTVSHLQKIDNIDLGACATYYNDQGYVGGIPEWYSNQYPDVLSNGQYDRRVKFSFNSRIRSKKIPGLSYGLNGTVMYQKNAEAYFWFDADTNIYRPYPGSLSNYESWVFYADPFLKYYGKNGSTHTFKNRVFYNNTDATNDQSNMSVTVYDEYQYQKKFKKLRNLIFLVGAMNTFSYAYGKVFSGKLASDSTTTLGEPGSFSSDNFAVYMQLEKKFVNRLNVLFGCRYEYFTLGGLTDSRPVFRAGLNFQAAKGTFLRLSVGQGYRFPSIGERYITTTSGKFGFYPNPDLQPENSLSSELGIKQLFKIGKWAGMADLSGFYELYDNYVEFNFGIWGRSNDPSRNMGFKFFNTGPARIYGVDFTLAGQGEIFRTVQLDVLLGYTYSVPQCIDPNYVFYTDPKGKQYSYITQSSDTTGYILKYRIQNLIKADIQITRKRWSGGVSGRYYSYMKNIDSFFYIYDISGLFKSGIVKYREEHNKGSFILDFRVSYALKGFKFSVLVNNLLNKEYSLRPLTMEAPRLTTVQVIYQI